MWWIAAAFAGGDPPPADAGTMAGHFQQATLGMLAVAVGDLGDARARGQDLATDKMAPLPLRRPARTLGKARTVEQAAVAVSRLGRACAECHIVGGRGPTPHDTGAIPGDDRVQRHIMAGTFLWLGLVTPLEQPYQLGLRELLPPVDDDDDGAVQDAALRFEEWIAEAQATRSWDDRSVVFGRMLETCAECHATAGVRP